MPEHKGYKMKHLFLIFISLTLSLPLLAQELLSRSETVEFNRGFRYAFTMSLAEEFDLIGRPSVRSLTSNQVSFLRNAAYVKARERMVFSPAAPIWIQRFTGLDSGLSNRAAFNQQVINNLADNFDRQSVLALKEMFEEFGSVDCAQCVDEVYRNLGRISNEFLRRDMINNFELFWGRKNADARLMGPGGKNLIGLLKQNSERYFMNYNYDRLQRVHAQRITVLRRGLVRTLRLAIRR
jgi:hypothetical protein